MFGHSVTVDAIYGVSPFQVMEKSALRFIFPMSSQIMAPAFSVEPVDPHTGIFSSR